MQGLLLGSKISLQLLQVSWGCWAEPGHGVELNWTVLGEPWVDWEHPRAVPADGTGVTWVLVVVMRGSSAPSSPAHPAFASSLPHSQSGTPS